MSFLYILDINPLSCICFANIFSHSVGCLLILLLVSCAVQKLFGLIWSHLFIFASVAFAFGIRLKKSLPRPMSRNFLPMFSSRSFMVSGLALNSSIHCEFIFARCVRLWSSFVLQLVAGLFSQCRLLTRLSFLCRILLSQINWLFKCGFISDLSILLQQPDDFYFFFLPCALISSFSTMLIRSGGTNIPISVLTVETKHQSFPLSYDVNCEFFVDAFNQLKKFPSISTLLNIFIIRECWVLSMLLLHLLRW